MMTRYFSFDITKELEAVLKIAIPDGIEHPEAVAKRYIESLEYAGILDDMEITFDFFQNRIDFAEQIDAEFFDFCRHTERLAPYVLEPSLSDLEPFLQKEEKFKSVPINQWIDVNDSLPTLSGQVLVWLEPENGRPTPEFTVDYYDSDQGFGVEQTGNSQQGQVRVTHWMLINRP